MLFTAGPYLLSVLVHITKHVPVLERMRSKDLAAEVNFVEGQFDEPCPLDHLLPDQRLLPPPS